MMAMTRANIFWLSPHVLGTVLNIRPASFNTEKNQERRSNYPHFTAKETETQKADVISKDHHAGPHLRSVHFRIFLFSTTPC